MRWGRVVSSTATQLIMTVSILFLAMFILGFVADPIINLYLDPYSTLFSGSFSTLNTKIDPLLTDDDEQTWTEHFIKGLASLGLLSFVKVLFALSPWQWWNLRSSGLMGSSGRAGGTGRDRLASISWLVVLIGVGTFLYVSAIPETYQCVGRLTSFPGSLERCSSLVSPDSRKGLRAHYGRAVGG